MRSCTRKDIWLLSRKALDFVGVVQSLDTWLLELPSLLFLLHGFEGEDLRAKRLVLRATGSKGKACLWLYKHRGVGLRWLVELDLGLALEWFELDQLWFLKTELLAAVLFGLAALVLLRAVECRKATGEVGEVLWNQLD